MKITLYKPDGFQEVGRKDNQEDYFVPRELLSAADSRFFILCDGMGGHENGEVASKTVCEALEEYFTKIPPKDYEVAEEYLNDAVKYAYQKLDEKDINPDSAKKMGTTLTCVYFGDNAVLVAHIGDSRVYQIRPSDYTKDNPTNAIKIETKDHSLVRQLVEIGEITAEEAKTHPKRNIITKCMQPHDDYDMPEFDSSDVNAGDYFFLCSDGVLENITPEILCEVLSEDISDTQKKEKLHNMCKDKTRDNFTGILLHVKKVESSELATIVETDTETVSDEHSSGTAPETKTDIAGEFITWIKQHWNIVLIAVAAIICLFWLFRSCPNPPDPKSNGGKQQNETPAKNDSGKTVNQPQKKKTFIEEVDKYKNTHSRKPLGMGMFLLSNINNPEIILVNENAKKLIRLVDSAGYCCIKFTDSNLAKRIVEKGCFRIFDFESDTIAKDTVAEIEWIIEKETKTSPAKPFKFKINTKGGIVPSPVQNQR